MRYSPQIARLIVLSLILLTLTLVGCSSGGETRSTRFDGYTLSFTTDPSPLQVGRPAAIDAVLGNDDGHSLDSCAIRYRQFMPGMQMDKDEVLKDMDPGSKSGHFHVQTAEFSMGGDWQLEFNVRCGQMSHTVSFTIALAWPQ